MPRRRLPRSPGPSAPATSASDPNPDLTERFALALARLGIGAQSKMALAVSGGGDSVALMLLFADWAARENRMPPAVLIVDHGLREESRKEADKVAQWARADGLAAHVLLWRGGKPRSNVEGEARAARYRLLGEWCAAHAVPNLFLAHTREDQAETFLLRLGRGSGVDGLSGMQPVVPFPLPGFAGVKLLRPLLDMSRTELRAYLAARGANWIEDPMNEDVRFARVRIRKTLALLEAAGVPAERIAEAARHLHRARQALDEATEDFLAAHARIGSDFALMDAAALEAIPREIGLRALSAVLMRVAGANYRPRFERLGGLFEAILSGKFAGRTLLGCRIGKAPKARAALGPRTLLIAREAPRKSAGQPKKHQQRSVESSGVG